MKIYWDNISDVDHAILMPTGEIVGNSFIARASAKGVVTDDENVIIDFSSGKKKFKQHLDNTIDHKLWVNVNDFVIGDYSDTEVKIVTLNDSIELILPRDAVLFLDHYLVSLPYMTYIKKMIELAVDYATDSYTYTNEDMYNVKFTKSPNSILRPSSIFFNYAHGLPNSTSFGCKNMAHGHLSYIYFENKDKENIIDARLFNENYNVLFKKALNYLVPNNESAGVFDQTLDSLYFISAVEPNSLVNEGGKNLRYAVNSTRGKQVLLIKNTNFDKWHEPITGVKTQRINNQIFVVVPYHTTIENLATRFFEDLFNIAAPQLLQNYDICVSEGLSKGATMNS